MFLMISLFSPDFFYLCFFSRLAWWNGSKLASCSEFCESMRREFSHRSEDALRMFQAYFCHTCYVFSTMLVIKKESSRTTSHEEKKIRSLRSSSTRVVALPVAATSASVSACIVLLLIKAGSAALCCTMLPGNNVFCQREEYERLCVCVCARACACVCLCGSVGEYCSFQGLAVIYEGPQRISVL